MPVLQQKYYFKIGDNIRKMSDKKTTNERLDTIANEILDGDKMVRFPEVVVPEYKQAVDITVFVDYTSPQVIDAPEGTTERDMAHLFNYPLIAVLTDPVTHEQLAYKSVSGIGHILTHQMRVYTVVDLLAKLISVEQLAHLVDEAFIEYIDFNNLQFTQSQFVEDVEEDED